MSRYGWANQHKAARGANAERKVILEVQELRTSPSVIAYIPHQFAYSNSKEPYDPPLDCCPLEAPSAKTGRGSSSWRTKAVTAILCSITATISTWSTPMEVCARATRQPLLRGNREAASEVKK